jgi:Lar family restriction alleviation protein
MVDGAKSCPFCGSDDLRVKSSGRWGWFVSCKCAAVGPSAGSREGAIERWNTRVEPVQGRLQI